MHMMFVDESGDPGYPEGGGWRRWGGSRFFARVGLIIHGWKWKAWNERLLRFKQNRGLTWDDEIRASDIRRGKRAFVGWEQPRRAQFLQDLAALIGLNRDITLLGVIIDKSKVDVTQRDRLVKPDVRSLELLLEQHGKLEDVAFRRTCRVLGAEPILEVVGEELGIVPSTFAQRRRNSYLRAIASMALCRYGGLTWRQVAELQGLKSGAAVSAQLSKLAAALEAGRLPRVLRRSLKKITSRLSELRNRRTAGS